ncbi:MAG TPA: response regulator [Candidatus Pelethocola excrementipullorum]|nr:response regulator [Candidatus Pelethocola excrementipullorum]
MIRVMVVEDEQFIRKGLILTTPWTKLGCQIVGEASNAMEAVEIARTARPDIVITDIRMPGMSGLDMITAIQEEVNCEFIIISGYDEFNYAKRALKLGVKGYLIKPVDQCELLEILENVVREVEKKHQIQVALESYAYLEEKLPPLKLFTKGKGTSHGRYVDAAVAYMDKNCASELTVKDVAEELSISDSYLGKLIKNKTGFTFLELLTTIRISRAIELMEEEEAFKVYEIAVAVGYKDPRHFSDVFKKVVGVSPSEYRRGESQ